MLKGGGEVSKSTLNFLLVLGDEEKIVYYNVKKNQFFLKKIPKNPPHLFNEEAQKNIRWARKIMIKRKLVN